MGLEEEEVQALTTPTKDPYKPEYDGNFLFVLCAHHLVASGRKSGKTAKFARQRLNSSSITQPQSPLP